MALDEPRVLVCGSRRWPWPDTVTTVLERLRVRHGNRLVVIEGAATGAERAAHRWCEHHGLPAWRHRCYPLAWAAQRTRRPRTWQLTGPQRTRHILQAEEPRLAITFHEDLDPARGETSDACLRALLLGIPVWLVPTQDADAGMWLAVEHFPADRVAALRAQVAQDLPGGRAGWQRCSGEETPP
jgi:hypothetical protein